MNSYRVLWLVVGFVVLAGIALLLIPASPFYLPNLLDESGRYDDQTTSQWIEALDSKDAKVRYKAIFALGAIGNKAGEAVPALAKILAQDTDAEARHQAALALTKMAPASSAAVTELAQALSDKVLYVRMNAAIALFNLRTKARPAVPALLKAVKDGSNKTNLNRFHWTIQEIAARALGRASAGSPESAEAVPVLMELLTAALAPDGTTGMRIAAAQALGEIGPPAKAAVPQLRTMLNEENPEIRRFAEEALESIEGKKAPKKG
jgi:HEAT repeat protein